MKWVRRQGTVGRARPREDETATRSSYSVCLGCVRERKASVLGAPPDASAAPPAPPVAAASSSSQQASHCAGGAVSFSGAAVPPPPAPGQSAAHKPSRHFS